MANGSILIGGHERRSEDKFFSFDAATGAKRQLCFSNANAADVEAACALAQAAFETFSALAPGARAHFLEVVADKILAIGDALIVTAMDETGLSRVRLEGERDRTTGQLRLFAAYVRQGDWLDATIDHALLERRPAPRPAIARMNVALGPVAVFGASNFPLAFSVAGGDTAAAFAAGCPVVVKGHPAHPGTSELVARAIIAAVAACNLPEGVFSYLPGASHRLGAALVGDARVKAVGFTGSRAGGLALMRIAAERAEPIPVYAEMSSVNPVIVLPTALAARAPAIAEGFVQSLTLGAGQFCTNPGIIFAVDGPGFDAFVEAAAAALGGCAPATMLTSALLDAYERGVAALSEHPSVNCVARGAASDQGRQARAALFLTDAAAFMADQMLSREVFGASSLIVKCNDLEELASVVAAMEGQLTASVHFDAADEPVVARLMPHLQEQVGRVLANGWPTGVEVTHAMVHGGPFPATSDGRSTSVGTLAMARFLRPVCYQGFPDALLPPALQAANPWRLSRRVNGVMEQID